MHIISRKMCLEKKISKNRKLEFGRKARKSFTLIIFYILEREKENKGKRNRLKDIEPVVSPSNKLCNNLSDR